MRRFDSQQLPFENPTHWNDIYHEYAAKHDARLRNVELTMDYDGRRKECFFNLLQFDMLAAAGNEQVREHPVAIFLNEDRGNKTMDKVYDRLESGGECSTQEGVCSRVGSVAPKNKYSASNRLFIKPEKAHDPSSTFPRLIKTLIVELKTLYSRESQQCGRTHPVSPFRSRTDEDEDVRAKKIKTDDSLHQDSIVISGDNPVSSDLIDKTSSVPFQHITLLCKHMINECNNCKDCSPTKLNDICTACQMRYQCSPFQEKLPNEIVTLTGSFKEGCNMPPFYALDQSGKRELIRSDLDHMFDLGIVADFENGSKVQAVIDTNESHPGYLRLEDIQIWQIRELKKLIESSLKVHDSFKNTQNGPAIQTTHKDSDIVESDFICYLRCPTWPPQAHPWIQRQRNLKWLDEETIQEIE